MDQIITPHPSPSSPQPVHKNLTHSPAGYEPGSMCFCRQCNTCAPHQKGMPCEDIKCPQCGAPMTRKF